MSKKSHRVDFNANESVLSSPVEPDAYEYDLEFATNITYGYESNAPNEAVERKRCQFLTTKENTIVSQK